MTSFKEKNINSEEWIKEKSFFKKKKKKKSVQEKKY
jgi:hypothetical protein